MGKEYSKEVRKLRGRIQQKHDEIDDYRAEIEEMESDIWTAEEEIGELEQEIEGQMELATEAKVKIECYFAELVKNLMERYGYNIERDEWMIKERYGIENVGFCLVIRSSIDPRVTDAVYSSTDFYPTPDSPMTLVSR